ncbi:MAG: DUF697 domain-containing protein [Fulvivirga sp.]
MKSLIKKVSLLIGVAVSVLFLLFAVNQIVGLYANLVAIDQVLAIVVTSIVASVVIICLCIPFYIIVRLPRSINYEEDPDTYRNKLQKRLRQNKIIKAEGLKVESNEELEQAVDLLNGHSQKIIKQTATAVFLSTAISQNGKLDALTVLITQSRMIWKVAHIYWQRPTIKDMFMLYANVATAGLIASEIEDIDISRQVEPVINALLKSPGRSIPVVGHAAHIITDSILEGSTNAFLTLRVGIIAQNYCGATHPNLDKRTLRKNAFSQASVMLRGLVVESSGKVVKSVMKAMKDAGKSTIKNSVDSLGKAAGNVKTTVGGWLSKKEKENLD